MNEDLVLQLGQEAIKITAMVAAPMLIGSLVVGLLVSIFQALTQINEATLTFIPKMIAVGLIFVFAGPWMLDTIKTYSVNLMQNIVTYVRE
jgi:flagellar biosynthetic protein FliQ